MASQQKMVKMWLGIVFVPSYRKSLIKKIKQSHTVMMNWYAVSRQLASQSLVALSPNTERKWESLVQDNVRTGGRLTGNRFPVR